MNIPSAHSAVLFGAENTVYSDYSCAGGYGAVVQPQDDVALVVSCTGPDAARMSSVGPHTIALKCTGALSVVDKTYAAPPVLPMGGHLQSSVSKGLVIQLDQARHANQNYIAAVEYERCETVNGATSGPQKTGTWTYFPQRADDWKQLTSADFSRYPHSFAPGNVAAALDILASHACKKAAATGADAQPQKAPPVERKYHTMRGPSNTGSTSSVASLSGMFAPQQSPPAQLAQGIRKQMYPVKVALSTAASIRAFKLTLVQLPASPKFSVVRLLDGVLTWQSKACVLETPGTWMADGTCIAAPRMSVVDLKVSLAPGRKLQLDGGLNYGSDVDLEKSVTLSGYMELLFIE